MTKKKVNQILQEFHDKIKVIEDRSKEGQHFVFTNKEMIKTGFMGSLTEIKKQIREEIDQSILDYISETFTRVEIIDDTGRAYTKWNAELEMKIQDGGRTLKIFVHEKEDSQRNNGKSRSQS